MKRDMDLVREILLALEETTDGYRHPDTIAIDRQTTAETSLHLVILEDAGFVSRPLSSTGAVQGLGSAAKQRLSSYRLMWQGHEFLTTVRDPEIWRKSEASGSTYCGA